MIIINNYVKHLLSKRQLNINVYKKYNFINNYYKRFYHVNNVIFIKNKIVLFSFSQEIANKINMLLSGNLIGYYDLKANNISKANGHRILMLKKDVNNIDENGLMVTSQPIHPNQSCYENSFVSSKIMSAPINIELQEYSIRNVNASFLKITVYDKRKHDRKRRHKNK